MSNEETEAGSSSPEAVAVLVISCDAYRDLWRPFFELFWRHWPDCPYPVYLGSERHTLDDPRVRPLDVGAQPDWSAACGRMLERIAEPTTLLLLEDYLFYARVDTARIAELAAWLRAQDGACLRLFPCPGPEAAFDAVMARLGGATGIRMLRLAAEALQLMDGRRSEVLVRESDDPHALNWTMYGIGGPGAKPELNKEPLEFEYVKPSVRSYK